MCMPDRLRYGLYEVLFSYLQGGFNIWITSLFIYVLLYREGVWSTINLVYINPIWLLNKIQWKELAHILFGTIIKM